MERTVGFLVQVLQMKILEKLRHRQDQTSLTNRLRDTREEKRPALRKQGLLLHFVWASVAGLYGITEVIGHACSPAHKKLGGSCNPTLEETVQLR
ncbi:hypothetical protein PHYPO_G00167910 [Pangasianodon hypophthalmus]|uniref:Uncharacterized protein n=1 Tax=Pangasianodon hypophthalmus TaxID=310915 RepID=A0A5N5JKX0_PANHP|nr:hypothetical protein PHYPO_G00167910 [Pangasianodon hypophthalmus]